MLIASGGIRSNMHYSARSDKNYISFTKTINDQPQEPIFAEVNISGNYSPEKSSRSTKLPKHSRQQKAINQVYWIPILEIDSNGIAAIEYDAIN